MKSRFDLSKILIIGFIGVYVLRFLLSLFMGMMPQDAYYYLYSEHLALSYFDHPPMVAYMLKLTSAIFGQSLLTIKLTDFGISLLSFFSFYYLSTLFLSKRGALYAAIFYGSTILLTIISFNTTPDVPLIFFWTIALIVLYKAIFQNKLHFWALSGVLMGLSFDSKYTGLFLLMGLFLFLLMSKNYRHLLFSKQMFVTMLLFLITVAPIIYWNFENDWISFAFQTTERVADEGQFALKPLLFLGTLGTQLTLLIPVLFCGMVVVYFKLTRKAIKKRRLFDDPTNFLLAFSVPIIGFFFAVSLITWVKLNWMMPGYVAAIILTSRYLGKKLVFSQVVLSLIIHILLFIQVAFYVVEVKSDDTWFGWEQLAEEVETLKEQNPDSFIFSEDGYKVSAVLNFYMDEHVYSGNVVGVNGLQFSIIDSELDHLEGRDAIFIDSENNFKNLSKSNRIPGFLNNYFNQVTELAPIIIEDSRSRPVRKFLIYSCTGYKGEAEGGK